MESKIVRRGIKLCLGVKLRWGGEILVWGGAAPLVAGLFKPCTKSDFCRGGGGGYGQGEGLKLLS